VRKRPVRPFKNPHELALEVTTSFVQLIHDRPAVGYVRADAAVDFKRYSEVLEENNRLKETLSAAQQVTAPFPAHKKQIRLTVTKSVSVPRADGANLTKTIDCSLMEAFSVVAESALLYEAEHAVLSHAAKLLLSKHQVRDPGFDHPQLSDPNFDEASIRIL